ncbi:hypothetical protein [Nocardia sp. NPDC003963]
MTGVLHGVPLSSKVVTALRAAGRRAAPHPVGTRDLLVELMRTDTTGDWSRITLRTGDPDRIARTPVADPALGGSAAWESVPLNDSCATALEVAHELAVRYELSPIPVGVVALGLVADESSAAAQALNAGLARADLLDLLQSEVLGLTLGGLDSLLPVSVTRSRRPAAAPEPVSAQEYSPLVPVSAPGPVSPVSNAPGGGRSPRDRRQQYFWMAVGAVLLCTVGYAMVSEVVGSSGSAPAVTADAGHQGDRDVVVGVAAPGTGNLGAYPEPGTILPGKQWPDGCTLIDDREIRAILPEAGEIRRYPTALTIIGLGIPVDNQVPAAGCDMYFELPTISADIGVTMLGIADPALITRFYADDRAGTTERREIATDIGNSWGPEACYTWRISSQTTADDHLACRHGRFYFEVEVKVFTEYHSGREQTTEVMRQVVRTVLAKMD